MSVFPLPVVPRLPFDLSRYTPITQIGRGAMAEVILAEMRVGHGVTKLAVLKRMWPDLASDSEFVSMFVREARLSASMNHPNIVQMHDVLDDADRPTIAMEYLDGQSLTSVLDRLVESDSLGLTLRLRVVANVLAALDYAHNLTDYSGAAHGIVHRNVNPKNVFVTYAGQVKLLDFGMAKSLVGAYQTRPGSVKGKLGYMAPEQVVGSVVDRRADIFAVGVMLWEMVAARRLWRGMSDGEIVRHLAGCVPIPPLPGAADLPRGLDRICARAVEVHAHNRYASAAEFASDLERLLAGSEDAHRRHLGKVVSLTFAEERAARRATIEAHLRRRQARFGRSGFGQPNPHPTEPPPTPAAAHSSSQRRASDPPSGTIEATPAAPAENEGETKRAPATSRITARVRIVDHLVDRWPRRWRWAPVAGLAILFFTMAGVLPRVWPRAAAKRVTSDNSVGLQDKPRVPRPSTIVIAPITEPSMTPPSVCGAVLAGPVAPVVSAAPAAPVAPAVSVAPAISAAAVAPAVSVASAALAVPIAPAVNVARPRRVRVARRDDAGADVPSNRQRSQPREDEGEASPPAATEKDDVLAPSLDLSGVPLPPTLSVPSPPPSRVTPDQNSARQLARRSVPRPIDETDPFWP